MTAILALYLLVAPAQAAAPLCTQKTTGMQLCIPKTNTGFDDWSRASINVFEKINSSGTLNSTYTVHTADWLQARRISGVSTGTANVWISSPTLVSLTTAPMSTAFVFTSSGSALVQSTSATAGHPVFVARSYGGSNILRAMGSGNVEVERGIVASTITASSGSFTGTGASSPYVITASSGIRMNSGAFEMGTGGFLRFADGTTQVTAPSGSFTVGFDSSTTLGSLAFPGSGATANNVCLARSTLTVTGHGCPVNVIFNAPVSECNSNQQMRTSFLLNGAFVSGISAGVEPGRNACSGTGVTAQAGFNIKIPAPSAGTLTFCAIAYSSVGNFESGASVPQLRVVELCNISN
jgi:hypothetical protein